MAKGGKKKKKEKMPCLAGGEGLLVVFLMVLRSLTCDWWRQRQWRLIEERGERGGRNLT
jgi:hypothetical protein